MRTTRKIKAIAALAAAATAIGIAACGSSAPAPSPPPPSPPAGQTVPAPPTFAQGPLKFTVVTCGKLIPAEQAQAGTGDNYGVVIAVTNDGAQTVLPQFTIEFLDGATVDGQNYTPDDAPPLAPGQSETLEADIVPSAGAGRPGDTCTVTKYQLFTPDLAAIGTYVK